MGRLTKSLENFWDRPLPELFQLLQASPVWAIKTQIAGGLFIVRSAQSSPGFLLRCAAQLFPFLRYSPRHHPCRYPVAEKTVARRAFDLALGKELGALLQEAKGRAARIEESSELWDLESWLTELH